jgi:hypothetical protein
MFAVPAEMPFTTPVENTVATDVLLLAHVPPVVALVSVVFNPMQIVVLPATDVDGVALMVTTAVLAQPVPSE